MNSHLKNQDLHKSTKNLLQVILILFFLVLLSRNSWAGFFNSEPKLNDQESDQVVQLLNSFSNGCTVANGPASDALIVFKNLSTTIKNIVNNPDCQGLSGAVGQLDSVYTQAESLAPFIHNGMLSADQKRIQDLESQKTELTTLISQETDPALMYDLKSQLYNVQINLVSARASGDQNLYEELQIRRAKAAELLVNSTKTITSQLLANQNCWVGQPQLLQQVVGVGAAVGASASLSSGQIGNAVLLGAGAQLVNNIINFFDNLSKNKKINAFNVAVSSTALTCTLEKMNDVFCAAVDGQKALKVWGSQALKPNADPIWSGINVLERDLPISVHWLDKLKTGGTPSSIADAETMNSIRIKEVRLENSYSFVLGVLGSLRPKYENTVGDKAKFNVLKEIASSIVDRHCVENSPTASGNPLCEQRSYDFATFYLLGITDQEYIQLLKNHPNGLRFSQFSYEVALSENFAPSRFKLENIMQQFQIWYDEAEAAVEVEKKITLNDDLETIFHSEALRESGLSPSPRNSYKNILEYLNSLKALNTSNDAPTNSAAGKKLLEDVINSLQIVIEQIDGVNNEQIKPDDAKTKISDSTRLNIGSSFIKNRIESLVYDQLSYLVRNPSLIPNDLSIQLLAANDYVSELKKYYPGDQGSTEMIQQMSSALSITDFSMDPFLSLFRAPIYNSLLSLQEQEKRFAPGPTNPGRVLRGPLCFYLMGSRSYGQYFDYATCEGLQIETITGLKSEAFSKMLFKKTLEERSCAYRNFLRKARVTERKGVLPATMMAPDFKAQTAENKKLVQLLLKNYLKNKKLRH